MPLRPQNLPIISKKLEESDFDPESPSLKSYGEAEEDGISDKFKTRDTPQRFESTAEYNNPFTSSPKKKVVRFQTLSSSCEITVSNETPQIQTCSSDVQNLN